jgi:non-ribosomal peptide synthetase component E (peptide arylation enzyme)
MPGVVYPDPATLQRYVEAGALGHDTLADVFRATAAAHADRLALAGPELRMTYRELDRVTDRLAAALLREGLAPLDRVVFQLGNCPELVFCWLACLKAGLIPICTLAAHREREIGYLAQLAEARLHLVQGDDPKFDDIGFARRMQAQVPTLRRILQARGRPQDGVLHVHALIESIGDEEARQRLARVELDPFQVAVFQLSGGTTGVPKIIPRMHNDYVCNMQAVARWMDYRPGEVLFMPLPMVHNLNMGCFFGPFLLTGGTVTLAPDLRPESLISLIAQEKPQWLVVMGPILARLETAISNGTLDFSGIRGVVTPSGVVKLRQLLGGAPVYTIFGMTEGVIMLTREGDPPEALDHTNGRPVHPLDEVRILVPGTETDVQPGEAGEPAFRGPYTLHGYYKAEERNREAFTRDGHYRSGDLMVEQRIEGRSHYVFKGRLKDVISRGGEKVNADEVEEAVCAHPSVASCAVIGMPDPVFDERVCVFVLLREGHAAPTVAELGAFLQHYGMAKYKWPERVETVDAFPTTHSGKTSKPALRELLMQRLQGH